MPLRKPKTLTPDQEAVLIDLCAALPPNLQAQIVTALEKAAFAASCPIVRGPDGNDTSIQDRFLDIRAIVQDIIDNPL